MKYVENNLMNGEAVIHKANIHWIIYVPGIIMFLLGLFLFVSIYVWQIQAFGAGMLALGGFVALILAIVFTVGSWITKITTELAVTSKRVIVKTGLIRRDTVELNHSKVESFQVDQSIVGRLLGFGKLTINGTGGGKTPIPNIDSPLDFRRQAMQVIDSSQ